MPKMSGEHVERQVRGTMLQRANVKRPGARRADNTKSVFLNIPYDSGFENLFLAYIAAISAFGFTPRATLEIEFKQRRLDRILKLIIACDYSIHDLSRVELDTHAPRTPRFNMPFELGLAVALERQLLPGHAWLVCESKKYRINKSLSDLDGTDIYVHDGTIRGVFRELANAFVRTDRQPSVLQMDQIYRVLRSGYSNILRRAGADAPFNARVFKDVSTLAIAAANSIVNR
jgi:hypothetical protein